MRWPALLGLVTTGVAFGLACAACLDFGSLGRLGPDLAVSDGGAGDDLAAQADGGCANLVEDPSFELTAWPGSPKITVDRVLQPHSGTYAVQICVADPLATYWVYISPSLGVGEAGVRYVAKGWVKVAPQLRVRMHFREEPGGGATSRDSVTTSESAVSDWQLLTVPAYTAVGKAADAGARIEVFFGLNPRGDLGLQTTDCFLVDDVYAARETCP